MEEGKTLTSLQDGTTHILTGSSIKVNQSFLEVPSQTHSEGHFTGLLGPSQSSQRDTEDSHGYPKAMHKVTCYHVISLAGYPVFSSVAEAQAEASAASHWKHDRERKAERNCWAEVPPLLERRRGQQLVSEISLASGFRKGSVSLGGTDPGVVGFI